MKPANRKVAFLALVTAFLLLAEAPYAHMRAGQKLARSPYPELCSAPRFSTDDEAGFLHAANVVEEPTVSTFEDVATVVEYDSVYSVHTAINPSQPLRSQAGSFNMSTILSDLERKVDPTKYDFVLIYSLQELPGWIHSGTRSIQSPAKNIGLANGLIGSPSTFPRWSRLRAAPHMNSVDFIDIQFDWYPDYAGTYIALHEMSHYWNVYWAQRSPGPRGWKRGDPVAWLAAASGHWSFVWEPDTDAGIMYSGALSGRFTDFDLYAMGLMGYAEASQTTYQVHEDTQPEASSVHYDLKLDDLIDSLSRVGSSVFEGNGHRIPDTDDTFKNLNTLIVIVKGRNEQITEQQRNLIVALANDIPGKWKIATHGRSNMVVAGVPPAGFKLDLVQREGKHLAAYGAGFDADAEILMNGEARRTLHDSGDPNRLVGKKLFKQVEPGATVSVQIRNGDGRLSNTTTFTRE